VTPEKLEEHVRKVVDEAPPLTPRQRDELAMLLRPAVTVTLKSGRAGDPVVVVQSDSVEEVGAVLRQAGEGML